VRGSDPFAAAGEEEASHNVGRGRIAEDVAVDWLRSRGFEILERNARTPAGEIDVVAHEDDTLCFVEVKARGSHRYGWAIGAVDRRKQRRLSRAAQLYLQRIDHSGPCRFDVVGLDPGPDGWAVTLIRDAFGFVPPRG